MWLTHTRRLDDSLISLIDKTSLIDMSDRRSALTTLQQVDIPECHDWCISLTYDSFAHIAHHASHLTHISLMHLTHSHDVWIGEWHDEWSLDSLRGTWLVHKSVTWLDRTHSHEIAYLSHDSSTWLVHVCDIGEITHRYEWDDDIVYAWCIHERNSLESVVNILFRLDTQKTHSILTEWSNSQITHSYHAFISHLISLIDKSLTWSSSSYFIHTWLNHISNTCLIRGATGSARVH